MLEAGRSAALLRWLELLALACVGALAIDRLCHIGLDPAALVRFVTDTIRNLDAA